LVKNVLGSLMEIALSRRILVIYKHGRSFHLLNHQFLSSVFSSFHCRVTVYFVCGGVRGAAVFLSEVQTN
jgi:hypothetical protein